MKIALYEKLIEKMNKIDNIDSIVISDRLEDSYLMFSVVLKNASAFDGMIDKNGVKVFHCYTEGIKEILISE